MSQSLRLLGILLLVVCFSGCGPDKKKEDSKDDASSKESGNKSNPPKLLGKTGPSSSPAGALLRAKQVGDQTALMNNLKQIALAFHNYQDTFRKLPPAAEGGLSWRVRILPMLGYDNLYKQFKLDEPWDSEHNKQLIGQMPAVYKTTTADDETTLMVFVGNGALYDGSQPPSIGQVIDGTVYTIGVIVAGADKAVPWTKPADLQFNPSDPYSALGDTGDTLLFVTVDGAVHRTSKSALPAQKLKALITKSGGENVVLP